MKKKRIIKMEGSTIMSIVLILFLTVVLALLGFFIYYQRIYQYKKSDIYKNLMKNCKNEKENEVWGKIYSMLSSKMGKEKVDKLLRCFPNNCKDDNEEIVKLFKELSQYDSDVREFLKECNSTG